MNVDEQRSARLLFAPELGAEALRWEDVDRPEVARAVASKRIPATLNRGLQRVAMKRGRLTVENAVVEPLMSARRAVLGPKAEGHPRLLIRMDEYPHYKAYDEPDRYGLEAFATWRQIMREADVPYLLAVLPALAKKPLSPKATGGRPLSLAERDVLVELRGERVTFALHGYDHRTRDPRPRYHSELSGLKPAQLEERLQAGEDALAEFAGIYPRVFVPPFNRFDVGQYELLARRYDVVCGGPETVAQLGFHATPLWRGEAVYMPSYAPLYGTAAEVLPVVQQLVQRQVALWVPVVLHWGWELDRGWDDLRRLAEFVAPYAWDWRYFLDAVEASR